MYEYSSLPEVCRFLLWSPHINVAATSGYIEFLEKRYLRGLYGDWAVELKENHKMVGTCGFANVDTSADTCEIGYVLSPAYRGKGYMTEAVQAVLDLAFDKLGLGCAKLRIIRENTDSIKLAERVGFSRDERGEYPQTSPRSGRDSDAGCHHLGRVPQMCGKRSGFGTAVPPGDGAGTQSGGDHGDSAGAEAGAGAAPRSAPFHRSHDAGHQTVGAVPV